MSRIPVSLIVDDGGPVNMYFFHDPGNRHELLVPPAFAAKFAAVCRECGIKGKFSFVPMPAGSNVRNNIDRLLSSDGKSGRIRELYEQGLPITLLTHWQSLYSDGREIGLKGLEMLAKRINKIFGKQVEWMSFAELADNWKFNGN